MTLIKGSEPEFMTADQPAQRKGGFAARSELALRDELESFCRRRWPAARVVHELVMGEGRVRADVVALDPAHISAFEIKGSYDDTTRLLHQVGMYQLCVPEVWMVVAEGHAEDARLIRHLIPSVGLIIGVGMNDSWRRNEDRSNVALSVEAEPVPRQVVPKLMLEMCWAAELVGICRRQRVSIGKKPTRPAMIRDLIAMVGVPTLQREVCAALRGRDAVWRADPSIDPATILSPQPEARAS